MSAKDSILKSINRVAESHSFLRPMLDNLLKGQIIAPEMRHLFNGANTYYEYWVKSCSDRFHDMGTIVRLGSEIENGLKYYYMEKMGHSNLLDLKNDPHYQENIFQRVQQRTNRNVIQLFEERISYNLNTNSHFPKIQEMMLYRHLYAHNVGLLNDKFVDQLKELIGVDLMQDPQIASTYPLEDTYYFTPIDRISEFIETIRGFFNELP